jgi:L-lactate permease
VSGTLIVLGRSTIRPGFRRASGFGTPVAVRGAILIGLGFSPPAASGLSLIANTAHGALGTPIIALVAVTTSISMVGDNFRFLAHCAPFG